MRKNIETAIASNRCAMLQNSDLLGITYIVYDESEDSREFSLGMVRCVCLWGIMLVFSELNTSNTVVEEHISEIHFLVPGFILHHVCLLGGRQQDIQRTLRLRGIGNSVRDRKRSADLWENQVQSKCSEVSQKFHFIIVSLEKSNMSRRHKLFLHVTFIDNDQIISQIKWLGKRNKLLNLSYLAHTL